MVILVFSILILSGYVLECSYKTKPLEKKKLKHKETKVDFYKRLIFLHNENFETLDYEHMHAFDFTPCYCPHKSIEYENSKNNSCEQCKKIGFILNYANKWIFKNCIDQAACNIDNIVFSMIFNSGFSREDLFLDNSYKNFFISLKEIRTIKNLSAIIPVLALSSLITLHFKSRANTYKNATLEKYLYHHTLANSTWEKILFDYDNFTNDVNKWNSERKNYIPSINTVKTVIQKNISDYITRKTMIGTVVSIFLGAVATISKTRNKIKAIIKKIKTFKKITATFCIVITCFYLFLRQFGEKNLRENQTSSVKNFPWQLDALGRDDNNVILCSEGRDCLLVPSMYLSSYSSVNPESLKPTFAHTSFFVRFNDTVVMQDLCLKKIKCSNELFSEKGRVFFSDDRCTILYRVVITRMDNQINSREIAKKQRLFINNEEAHEFLSRYEHGHQYDLLNQEFLCTTKNDQDDVTGRCTIKFINVDDKNYKIASDGNFPFKSRKSHAIF